MKEELLFEWKTEHSLDEFPKLIEELGYEIIEKNPKDTIIAGRGAFITGKDGYRFTFKTLGLDPWDFKYHERYGFVYTRIIHNQDHKNLAFVEVTE